MPKALAGVQIEGLGEQASVSAATIWACRANDLLGALGAQWLGDQAERQPEPIDTSIDPTRGTYRTSAATVRLLYNAAVARVLLRQAVRPVGVLSAAVLAGTTTLVGLPSGMDDQVVYIGRETVRLGTWSGSAYTGCSRGWHSSPATAHAVGARVWAQPPFLRGRWVKLWVATDAGYAVRWQGQLTEARTADHLTVIELDCDEALGALSRAKINTSARDLSANGQVWVKLSPFLDLDGQLAHARQVRKLSVSGGYVVVQVGDAPFVVLFDGASLRFDEGVYPISSKVLTKPEAKEGEVRVALEQPIYELFVVSRELDVLYGGISATSALELPYHPVAIALAILTSTASDVEYIGPTEYDVLASPWAANLAAWLDAAQWFEVIEATREVQIDELFLGWDGKAEALMDLVVGVLLRPYGFYLGFNEAGQFTVHKEAPPDVLEVAAAPQLSALSPAHGGGLEINWQLGSTVETIHAKVGARPWDNSPSTITVQVHGRQAELHEDAGEWTLDLRTIARARITTVSTSDTGDGDEVVSWLLNAAAQASRPRPRLQTTVFAPEGETMDLGRVYALGGALPVDGWFLDPETGELAVLPSENDTITTRAVGRLLGRRYDVRTGAWQVELELSAYATGQPVRLRAPSMEVESTTPGSYLLHCASTSQFGDEAADNARFRAGDPVVLVHRNGKPWADSVLRRVVSTPSDALELDGWYASDPGAADPPLMVRLADSSEWDNGGAYAAGVARPWVFLGDDNEEMDVDGSTTRADVYG